MKIVVAAVDYFESVERAVEVLELELDMFDNFVDNDQHDNFAVAVFDNNLADNCKNNFHHRHDVPFHNSAAGNNHNIDDDIAVDGAVVAAVEEGEEEEFDSRKKKKFDNLQQQQMDNLKLIAFDLNSSFLLIIFKINLKLRIN